MSSVTLGPPFVIDGPLPLRPKYGLLDAAQVMPPSVDEHWLNGATIRAYSSDLPDVWAPCNEGSVADIKNDGGPTLQPTFGPFTVYLPVTCNTFSSRPDDEFRARATAAFEAKEGWAVERELAQGIGQPLNPFLGDINADVLSGVALTPMEALALLEDAIADTAEGGMIHADPGTVIAWASTYLVFESGQNMRTAVGTPVAVGRGYRNARVQGHAAPGAKQAWAFASGPVQVRRTNIEIMAPTLAESLDRTTNGVTEYVERHYLVDWDTSLQAAVLVDRSI